MVDFEKEKRAYELLRWVPYSFPEDFDWEKAALGVYSKAQKERSDKGEIYENFVFIELLFGGLEPKYWNTKSKAEVDFILEKEGKIVL